MPLEFSNINNEEDLLNAALFLLRMHEFKISHVFEGSGPDGGRDIEAVSFEIDASQKIEPVKWWIELKFRKTQKGTLSTKDLNNKLHRASTRGVKKYLLITNVRVSASFIDEMERSAFQYRIDFRYWDKHFLENKLQNSKEVSTFERLYSKKLNIQDRISELNEFLTIIKSKNYSSLLIFGKAGVGKSSIASCLVAMLSNSYDIAWIDCRVKYNVGFMLSSIAKLFFELGIKTNFSFSSGLRIDEFERVNLLINHAQERKTIIVLDNFEFIQEGFGLIENEIFKYLISKTKLFVRNKSILILTTRNRYINQSLLPPDECIVREIDGFDIEFIQNEYMVNLNFLEQKLNKRTKDKDLQKNILLHFEGNPLALQAANQLSAYHNISSIIDIASSRSKNSVAQNLVIHLSSSLLKEEITALNKFSQFHRPLSRSEIKKFICTNDVLNSLLIRRLVEPSPTSSGHFHLHPLTIEVFDCRELPEKQTVIVKELVDSLKKEAQWGTAKIDKKYNHGILRDVINLLIKVNLFNDAGEILIAIGTRAVSLGDIGYLQETTHQLENNKSEQSKLKPKTRAWLLKVQGHIADLYGRYLEAWDCYQTMVEFGDDLDDPLIKAAGLNGMGSVKRFLNQLDEAISIYTESLAIRNIHKDEVGISNSQHNLGAVYLEKGDYSDAFNCLSIAHTIREGLNDEFRRSATEIYLSECLIHLEKFKEAEKMIDKSIKTKKTLNDYLGYVWAILAKIKLLIITNEKMNESIKALAIESLELSIKTKQMRAQLIANMFCGCAFIDNSGASYENIRYWVNAKEIADGMENKIMSERAEEGISISFKTLSVREKNLFCKKIARNVKI